MKKIRKLLIIPFMICIAVLVYTALFWNGTHSRHKNEPSDEIITLTQQTQYPIGTEKIVVCVMNSGGYDGEINKPYLEVERDGKWYIVKKPLQESETSNLLYVSPGETKQFEVFLTAYDSALSPGRYRAVFDFHGSDKYYAFQFELVEA